MNEVSNLLGITTMDIIRWCVIGIIVVGAIITAVAVLLKKLYGLHKSLETKEREVKDNYDKLANHDESISDIKKDISDLITSVKSLTTSWGDMQKCMVDMQKADNERDKKVDALIEVTMENTCDRITQKANYYIRIGGIPEDEIDSFSRMYKAYKAINGNHGAEAKYNFCINHLPILPVEKTVMNNE